MIKFPSLRLVFQKYLMLKLSSVKIARQVWWFYISIPSPHTRTHAHTHTHTHTFPFLSPTSVFCYFLIPYLTICKYTVYVCMYHWALFNHIRNYWAILGLLSEYSMFFVDNEFLCINTQVGYDLICYSTVTLGWLRCYLELVWWTVVMSFFSQFVAEVLMCIMGNCWGVGMRVWLVQRVGIWNIISTSC